MRKLLLRLDVIRLVVTPILKSGKPRGQLSAIGPVSHNGGKANRYSLTIGAAMILETCTSAAEDPRFLNSPTTLDGAVLQSLAPVLTSPRLQPLGKIRRQ